MQEMSDEQMLARWRELLAAGDQAALDAFAAQVDALDLARERRLTAPGALARAAHWYAEQDLPVFPIRPRDKRPFPGSRGFKDATTDPAQIQAWWKRAPQANIGLPTGVLFDVIDVDPPEGSFSLVDLREAGLIPPLLGKAATGGGGMHLYIAPTGDGNTTRALPGIDYRGAGGYVVAPPSIGPTGGRYGWMVPLDLMALGKAA